MHVTLISALFFLSESMVFLFRLFYLVSMYLGSRGFVLLWIKAICLKCKSAFLWMHLNIWPWKGHSNSKQWLKKRSRNWMFTLHVHILVCVQCRCLPKCTFCNTCVLNNIDIGVIFSWSFLGWLVGWLIWMWIEEVLNYLEK